MSQDKVGVVRGAPCVRPESFFAAPAVAAVAVAHRCCGPRLAPRGASNAVSEDVVAPWVQCAQALFFCAFRRLTFASPNEEIDASPRTRGWG